MLRLTALFVAFSSGLYAQQTSFPLESVDIEGTTLPKQTVLELTAFRLGSAVDEHALEAGCKKLEESGLFEDVKYRYGPGPKRGYVVTLSLVDQKKLRDATIDIPGVDEAELWRWLTSKYPTFDHKAPDNPTGQEFLLKQIEQHAGAALAGQHLVTSLEQEFAPRPRMIVSFQLEKLPIIASMRFTGQQKLNETQLDALMRRVISGQGYSDRKFRQLVELNLRPAYEEIGMYRVRFPGISAQKSDDSAVNVAVAIDEGPQFTLGTIEIIGDDLPRDAMKKAANIKTGAVANWTQIQKDVWDMERPVKRLGYFAARSKTERILHDDTRVLDVSVTFEKGPLYRFGQVRFVGLSQAQETLARRVWSATPGSPYDFLYANDFLREFSRLVDFRQFKKYEEKAAPGIGDRVMDVTVNFEPK